MGIPFLIFIFFAWEINQSKLNVPPDHQVISRIKSEEFECNDVAMRVFKKSECLYFKHLLRSNKQKITTD